MFLWLSRLWLYMWLQRIHVYSDVRLCLFWISKSVKTHGGSYLGGHCRSKNKRYKISWRYLIILVKALNCIRGRLVFRPRMFFLDGILDHRRVTPWIPSDPFITQSIRRHTDPNGGYAQNWIKQKKGLNYFKQNCPIFQFAIQTFLRGWVEKKIWEKETDTNKNLKKKTWQWLV